ncbi:hypothetical protein [Streptomyces sp. AC512_CC834]|uniref:hypothetical protein n=1 Tax=Streptomyces sp. AC512_CC834 TaxID=2823691 RepID=UPI001C281253|nr:hypothetical protein [Streptomyces sp. AC512_CC834]
MLKPENLRFLGMLGVDAGMFAIVDPISTDHVAYVAEHNPGDLPAHDFEYATVAPTPMGDGVFEVFAVLSDEGDYVGAYIDFTKQYQDADVDDMPLPRTEVEA